MSIPIEVPNDVYSKAAHTLLSTTFQELLESMIKGPCKHLIIEKGCKFEMAPKSMEACGEKICKFNFAITHECDDDRSNWVEDRTISVSVRFEGNEVVLKGL